MKKEEVNNYTTPYFSINDNKEQTTKNVSNEITISDNKVLRVVCNLLNEDRVCFNTANLLKECGFPQEIYYEYRYDKFGNMCYCCHPYFLEDENDIKDWFDDIAAPSQSNAIKWLRETKNIYIYATPNLLTDDNGRQILKYITHIITIPDNKVLYFGCDTPSEYCNVIEEGIEKACKYLLKSKQKFEK